MHITLYYSLRQRGSWLRSLWAHDLQRSRLIQDFETFRARLEPVRSPQIAAEAVRDRLPSVSVRTEWLEDLQGLRYGLGNTFAEFLDLPPEKAAELVGPTRSNPRLPEDILQPDVGDEPVRVGRCGVDRPKGGFGSKRPK